ncbi:LOW QUALITY PROTEIN: laminin subunit beta-2-like [Lethenteron reissneri]|uniref:LOW QUALITY PROTEIN: laminin subunit beta-2-like n=1 Tax=Lethenteron reissneri TaxID=7753 RepID=UPI002AB7C74D|nr:LOW QUALITY PROTEIN: laminin subunit beta-2-like [Lethenteron reissneri]
MNEDEAMLYRAVLLCVALGASVASQETWGAAHGCAQGSCYPVTGDLLVGRADKISASSTCGLVSRQRYCIVSHLQEQEKCFHCDSRRPYQPGRNPNSHRIENVVTSFAPSRRMTWWQAENGVEKVTIQLDLEAEFHFTHLIMTFKTFRPAAMLVERSSNFGRSWKPYRYFAYDCDAAFPGIATRTLQRVDDVVCESRYSDIEPSTEGEVIFKVLDPAIKITDPYSHTIQDLLKITNLRINLTRLHTLGDNLLDPRSEIKQKYYYSLYELVVRGSCFCYGHASECAPIAPSQRSHDGMVHGRCVCKHRTRGLNCEQCEDFYADSPWRPAEGRQSHECKKCNCNSHSDKCHFDVAVYKASGNVSGGVCEDCRHNTMGRNCELCNTFFYRDPRRDAGDADACLPCDCEPDGTLNGGLCDGHTDAALGLRAGHCRCKPNAEGPRCDRCKAGFFGLNGDDPLGCRPCQCNPLGTLPGRAACDATTGDCFCKRLVTGRRCDQCLPGHWGLGHNLSGCRVCECDDGGAIDNKCSMSTGQCRCRSHMTGRTCGQVEPGYFVAALDYHTYEAEEATRSPGVTAVVREPPRERAAASWTGRGMCRVPEGGRLDFSVSVPFSMEYDLVLRYEPQLPEEWEEVVVTVERPGAIAASSTCGNTIPSDDLVSVTLPPGSRYVVVPQPVCLEKGLRYGVRVDFKSYRSGGSVANAHVLVDSLVLLPRHSSLEMFIAGDPASTARRTSFERYRCGDAGRAVSKAPVTDVCAGLLRSVSALVHNGSLPCQCNTQGSSSTECNPVGGQCRCKPNVAGRRCDQCVPGTFGFGPSGCRECHCDQRGSTSAICDAVSGQCACRPGAFGRQCDRCEAGHWGFPECRACRCHGHSDECNPRTGACLSCRGHTAGDSCDRCASGYYGSPGSGEQCRPCQCPEGPGTGRHFASGCSHDPRSRAVACACLPGFTGARCDQCAPGHYGDLRVAGGRCQPCQCNGNIDPTDAASCDGRTGRCLRCLRDTEGSSCQNCRTGYYGNATSQRRCQKCTCVTAGTERSSCGLTDGACACDARSGQCRCLPNVQGLACDRCAPNHWGLSQGAGCRPCGCDPAHSAGPSCSEFNGQCHCLAGFGGLTCNECQENHWGEPRVKCSACDCEASGVLTRQCERATGQCACRPGVAGRRCDRCARGFSGAFPACEPCHQPCFPDWEAAISELGRRAGSLSERATRLLTGGADAGPYARRMAEVEETLAGVRELLAARNASAAAVERLSGLIDDVGRQVEAMTGRLAQLEAAIGGAAKQNGDANVLLSELEGDAREASTRAGELGHQIDTIKHSNFRGAYGSVKDSYQQSREAERKASAAATSPAGPVARSEATRQRAEKFMAAKRAELEQRLEANADALQELGWEARQLELNELNEKVCGVTRDVPCAESACGGVGCRDEDGRPHCGGMNCGGVATVASNALERSTIADREMQKALGDLDKLHQQVMDVKSKAGKAKEEAQGTLQRANGTRAQVEGAVQGLRELIKQIKEFLTEEGASPDSIELVAERVLRLGVPASPQQIGRLADEIKERVSSLANVDAILARTAGSINEAERLLQDAKRAKARAENAKSAAETVRKALAGAREAQAGAEVAIQQARADLHDTQDTLASTESETAAAGQRLQDATARLLGLERDVDALKMKTAANSLAAGKADKAAGMAKQRADEAKQMHDGELRDRFRALQDLFGKKGRGAEEARRRVEQLREQARAVLAGAQARLARLAELEVAYDGNAVELERKAHRLRGLEDKLRGIVYAINKQINVYNTCQ